MNVTSESLGSHSRLPRFDHARSLLAAWTVLVVLTLLSFWFRDHGLPPSAAAVAILTITFVKVYMVGHSFMEIHRAPRLLRLIFGTWCGGTLLVLVALLFLL